jgi:hypothetical protein
MVESRKEASVTRHTYEIRVIGSLGPATREAFADMVVEVEPSITVLSGDLDQRGLHALLDRVRALGLELVDIKQAPPSALRPAASLARAVGQAVQLDELEAERQDAVERAVQGRLVQVRDQDGVRAVGFDAEIAERLATDIAQTSGDRDLIAVRAHVASVGMLLTGTGTIYARDCAATQPVCTYAQAL